MKKLLYFVVSVLSLGVIFAAGWASGVGTVTNGANQPAALKSEEITDECPDCTGEDKLPDSDDGDTENNFKRHKYGFRMKLPFPHVERDDLIRSPKTVN